MDCLDFTDRIEALLDGALPEDLRLHAATHAARCPDCRALLTSLQEEPAPAAAEVPDGLTEAILARTSGPPCGRAQALLGDLVDGALDDADGDLVDVHLRHCPACTAVAAAFRRLAEDLPAFAALNPDPALVGDVLARTLRPRPRDTFRNWLRAAGRRFLNRPRIAWEAGYVAALAVWLICGASWSPLRTTAVELQAFVQRGAAGTQAAGARSVAALDRTVTALRGETLLVTAGGASEVTGWLSGLSSWPRRAAGAAPELGRHWRQLIQAVRNRDLFSGVAALRSLSLDAGAVLAELFAPLVPSTSNEAEPTPARSSRP